MNPVGRVVLAVVLAANVLAGACGPASEGPTGHRTTATPAFVLAFYYPWYGRPDGPSARWYHWNPASPRHDATHSPVLGLYDSNDSAVVRRHIRWAKAAGIDGFISSWWGPASFEERSLRVLLAVAEQENFRVTALIEHPFTAARLREDFQLLVATHASSRAWLRVDDRPVVFVYERIMNRFTPEQFRSAFEGSNAFTVADTHDHVKASPFDGVFSYGPVADVEAYMREIAAQSSAHRAAGRIFVAATLPGYDDRVIRSPGRLLPRDDGALFQKMWTAATRADWVTITSWNEWHEGTEVEPSVEQGARYLELTRALAETWRVIR